MAKRENEVAELVRDWPLSPAATLGSAVRTKGIMLEIRAKLPQALRKSLDIEAGALTLVMPETDKIAFRSASAIVSKSLETIAELAVIPREIEEILAINTTERHRWLSDGRLPSAGTRTVKLRGRARKITFHVFDPRLVEDILDRDLVTVWREDDALAASENRRRAAMKAKLTRSLRASSEPRQKPEREPSDKDLRSWEEFDRDGLLR